ncbi:nucleotidyl transferase AbiEii/AbiGii toxin family protein [Candidatus Dependentiae bacterium]|nr:nucleotidyl transferase AbiEii/AbiGii toxin family protein [Candidatus Dependentiae bacterium]
MTLNKDALLHSVKMFSRDYLTTRKSKLGFHNLYRFELFLWDLEMFLQFQEIFKDDLFLKGGAAVQFYLPVKFQRTSIDIDMVTTRTREDINNTILKLKSKFNNLINFRKHIPKNPKTKLPLYTYFMDYPSICTTEEIHTARGEIKLEFLISKEQFPIQKVKAPELFIGKMNKTYNLAPLNLLLADKLTTFGPNTIGIPIEREDELIKHIYDIINLIQFNFKDIDFELVKEYFSIRAEQECLFRGIKFSPKNIFTDILKQLSLLSMFDFNKYVNFERLINNFQSLYLNRAARMKKYDWANNIKLIELFFKMIETGTDIKTVMNLLFSVKDIIEFKNVPDSNRSSIIKEFRVCLVEKFGRDLDIPEKVLLNRHHKRIVFYIINQENLSDVCTWIIKKFA